MIYYVTDDDPTDVIELMRNGFSGPGKELINETQDDFVKRVVFTRNQFREKLLILDAELDDRIIEIMKLFMVAHLENENPDMEIEEFLFDFIEQTPAFSVRINDGNWGSTDFSKDMYDGILEDFKSVLQDDKEVVIDRDWALAALNKRTQI